MNNYKPFKHLFYADFSFIKVESNLSNIINLNYPPSSQFFYRRIIDIVLVSVEHWLEFNIFEQEIKEERRGREREGMRKRESRTREGIER